MTTGLQRARQIADRMVEQATAARKADHPTDTLTSRGNSFSGVAFGDDSSARSAKLQYERNTSWTYASVRPIANRIAGLPFMMGRLPSNANSTRSKMWAKHLIPQQVQGLVNKHAHGSELEIVESHEFLNTIHNPNPLMTSYHLLFMLAASLQLAGRAYWWMVKSKQVEGEIDIWPLPAHWVTAVNTSGFRAEWKITPHGSTESFTVPGESIAYFAYPKASDPFGSLAPVEAAAQDILSDESIKNAQHRGYENDVTPGLIVGLGKDAVDPVTGQPSKPELTRDQYDQAMERIDQLYRGTDRNRRFLILDRLIDSVDRITTTPHEMDYLASGTMVKNAIMQIFGVNPIIAGEVEGANRASATVADDIFIDNVINPTVALITQTVNKSVMPIFRGDDFSLVAWLEEAVATDPDEVRKDWDLGIKGRNVTRDEYRLNVLKLPPLPNGQGESIVMSIADIIVPTDDGEAQSADPEHGSDHEDDNEAARRLNGNGKKHTRIDPVRYRNAFLKVHDRDERTISADLQKFFKRQESDIIKNLRDTGGSVPAASLFDSKAWDRTLREIMLTHLTRSGLTGALLEQQAIGGRTKRDLSRFDPEDLELIESILIDLPPSVQASIRESLSETLAQDYWSDINKTTLKRLDGALAQALSEGLNINQTAGLIRTALGAKASANRAVLIARTETTNSLNSGSFAVRQELANEGLVKGQEWLATLDQVTRETHVAADNQQVGIKDLFVVGGERTPYPGHWSLSAAERNNCRCTAISITIADEASFTANRLRGLLV